MHLRASFYHASSLHESSKYSFCLMGFSPIVCSQEQRSLGGGEEQHIESTTLLGQYFTDLFAMPHVIHSPPILSPSSLLHPPKLSSKILIYRLRRSSSPPFLRRADSHSPNRVTLLGAKKGRHVARLVLMGVTRVALMGSDQGACPRLIPSQNLIPH